MPKSETVVAAALGECVHVAGVMNFLCLAEEAGWRTVFLGPAGSEIIETDRATQEVQDEDPRCFLVSRSGARNFGLFSPSKEPASEFQSSPVAITPPGTAHPSPQCLA